MTRAERFRLVCERFAAVMPDPKTELNYTDPFSLLCAVILSAQCTDKRVNMITPGLLGAFPTAEALAAATPEQVFPYIKSVSYPNNKSRLLVGMARTLVEKFGGKVPDDMDALLDLPGVGRKTANVILAVIYGKAAMAVDTHVFRVSERICFTTNSKTPLQTERELVKYIPAEDLPRAHHWLILHGRYVCKARKPDCLNCPIADLCRYYAKSGAKSATKAGSAPA